MHSPERIEATEVKAHVDRQRHEVVIVVMATDRELRIALREEQAQALGGQLDSANRDLRQAGARPPRGQPPRGT